MQHAANITELPGNKALLLQVGMAIDFLLVLFRIGEVVLLLVVTHLPVYLFLSKRIEMYVGNGVRNLLDLGVRKALEYV